MIDRRTLLLSMGTFALASATPAAFCATEPSRWPMPPQPRREPRVVGRFGHRRNDDYAWLRPADWYAVLRDPASLGGEIREAVLAENAYAAAMMAPSEPLQRRLVARMTAIEAEKPAPFEIEDAGFLYYERRSGDGDHPVYARRPVDGGAEQVLLDVGAEAKGKKFYSLHGAGPQRAPGGNLFGWAADETGSGIFSIRALDMRTGKLAVSDVRDSHGEHAFTPDDRYLFWVGRDDRGRPSKVVRRDVAAGTDTVVYEERDAGFFINLRTTASGRYVAIRTLNGAMSEVRLVPTLTPTAVPLLVEPRRDGLTYDVDDWNGRLVVLTNADGAADFKLMTADETSPGRATWRELVPHRPGRFIHGIHPFAGHLVREEWRDANPRLVLMTAGGGEKEIAFEEPAYAIAVPSLQAGNARALAFVYQSPRTPPSSYLLDLESGKLVPPPQPVRTTAYDRGRYEVRRLFARTEDGEDVPITVLMRKGMPLNGHAPLLLYGYGSYGSTVETLFSPGRIALVDVGWVYAIAHMRGGPEKGTNWWRSVLKHGKKKTFTDFIACAEHLIAHRYTEPRRIVAHGLSAGGLLMGAVFTMRPDLWAGVIAQVPFVDVLNTMDDFETHPLGTTALPIWGDPRVPEDYAYCASYSPYDNLRGEPYPALLATGGVADDRVAFWEPVKLVARARALTTASNPLMVNVSMTAGHMGEPGEKAARERQALFFAFAIWAAGRKWGDAPQRPA